MTTEERFRLITADPAIVHGQACITGSRVPVSVVLDCLAAGMTEQQILTEYPTHLERGGSTGRSVIRGGPGPGRDSADCPGRMKLKLDENMPAIAQALLAEWGHDVTTASEKGLAGSDDPTVAERGARLRIWPAALWWLSPGGCVRVVRSDDSGT